MSNFRSADHAMGLELQLEELTEQRERARVQRCEEDVRSLSVEIDALQAELAATAERATVEGYEDDDGPRLQYGEELRIDHAPD